MNVLRIGPSERLPAGSLPWLFASLVLVIGPHVIRLPWWIPAVALLFGGWRALIEIRGWSLPARWVRLLLNFGVLAGVLTSFRTIFGRDAGMALLVVLITLKLLELRSVRDFMLMVFLCYFLVLGNLLYSQSLLTASYMVGAIIVITAALIQLNLGTNPLRRLASALRLSLMLLAQALPVMVVLFILFPRVPGPLWSLPHDAHSGITGMSADMYPGSLSELSQSNAVAFRVDFPDGQMPAAKDLYWRGLILWDTDGQGWFPGQSFPPLRELPPPDSASLLQHIALEPHNARWLFALDRPASLPDRATMLEGHILQSTTPIKERWRYHVFSQPADGPGAIAADVRRRALQLPKTISPRVIQLVRRWQATSASAPGIVAAALKFFRDEGFRYTLTPGVLGDDPIDDFLFHQRRGFCEHYAAAFTTLMRVAGIPARVVIGYQGGEYNPLGNYWMVRQANAHAWSEVWLEERGWVRVDPTAAIAPERIEHGIESLLRWSSTRPLLGKDLTAALERVLQGSQVAMLFRHLGFAWDTFQTRWNLWVLGYNTDRQQRFLSALGFADTAWLSMASWMSASMLTLLLLISLFLWWRSRQRADPAQQVYQKFCNRLAKAGISRHAWEGPVDFARRTSASFPASAQEINAITHTYIGLRYGKSGPDEGLLTELRRRVRQLRINKKASRHQGVEALRRER